MNADPSVAAKQKAGLRRHFEDPAARAANASRLQRYLATMPTHELERRREHGKRMAATVLCTPEHRAKCNSPEAKRKAGARRTETTLAWCPPAYRDDYRRLLLSNSVRAPEARRMILEQVAAAARKATSAARPQGQTHEERMALVASGRVRLIDKPDLRPTGPAYSLVGNATGML